MTRSAGATQGAHFIAFDDLETMSDVAARNVVESAQACARARNRFVLLLSGGESPRRVYELLAGRYASEIDWGTAEVYFSDERCVPVTDARNNFAMVQDLLISRVPIVAERVHPIPTVGEPRELAERYDALLRQRFDATDTPAFDVAILGIGTDGHTASLFPGSSALRERERWALAVTAPPGVDVPDRITLTLPALNRSRRVLFVVAGRNKGDAVRQLSATPASTAWPASLVRGLERTDWLLDATAAS